MSEPHRPATPAQHHAVDKMMAEVPPEMKRLYVWGATGQEHVGNTRLLPHLSWAQAAKLITALNNRDPASVADNIITHRAIRAAMAAAGY